MARRIDEHELEQAALTLLHVSPGGMDIIRFMAWVRKQPLDKPLALVGSTAAAGILGIPAPHVARLRRQGRMPDPIHVEGGYNVYPREAVVRLARELGAERATRADRRSARDEQAEAISA